LGSLTQNRTVPVTEIEPLNVVPVGRTIGTCDVDSGETVKVGTVVANTKRVVHDIINNAVNSVNVSNLVFFIFPPEECLVKLRMTY
jgi:hypothetical protein